MERLILEDKVIFPKLPNGTPMYKRHRAEVRSDTKPISTLIGDYLNANSTKELRDLLGGQYFDYSKSVRMLQYIVSQIAGENDIVLDFFAGSGTTAHAVMAQNIEDGGNRKYILVQIPEYTPENSEARKAGFETIADITAERVRRAAKKLNCENGFRYFKLDRSHFRVFEQMQYEKGKSKEEVLKLLRMSMFHDNTLMANWSPIGVAFEVGLKNGMPLDSEYKAEKNGKYNLHYLTSETRVFVFCFDEQISEDIAKILPQNAKFICLDKALTDSVKLNIVAQIGLENIETI
jgi:adenine-specific DNA-methyltransferase